MHRNECCQQEETFKVFTTVRLLKLLRGRQPHRTTALNDGSGHVTMIPFILGGNILLGTAFIGPGTERPDWSAPAKWTQPASVGMPYLPGMRGDHFSRNHTKVFATESGSNCSELLEYMLLHWIFPEWRSIHPEGPLVILQDAPNAHKWTRELCEYCAENEIFIVKFPHNSTTMTQCLDVWWFKAFRAQYRIAVENLKAAWEFSCGYLDYSFECVFRES
jgi:hypothetical protein